MLMWRTLSRKQKYEVLSYTADEYAFAEENEVNMWEYFVSNKILYNTDRKLRSRFIDPAPFSKFRLAFDNETPVKMMLLLKQCYCRMQKQFLIMQNTNLNYGN